MWAGFTALGDGVQLDLPMPQSEKICTNSPSPYGGLLRGLLPRLTSVRLPGTVVTSSARRANGHASLPRGAEAVGCQAACETSVRMRNRLALNRPKSVNDSRGFSRLDQASLRERRVLSRQVGMETITTKHF